MFAAAPNTFVDGHSIIDDTKLQDFMQAMLTSEGIFPPLLPSYGIGS
jgi:hypothetical protein